MLAEPGKDRNSIRFWQINVEHYQVRAGRFVIDSTDEVESFLFRITRMEWGTNSEFSASRTRKTSSGLSSMTRTFIRLKKLSCARSRTPAPLMNVDSSH